MSTNENSNNFPLVWSFLKTQTKKLMCAEKTGGFNLVN